MCADARPPVHDGTAGKRWGLEGSAAGRAAHMGRKTTEQNSTHDRSTRTTKWFRPRTAVDGISFTVQPGQVTTSGEVLVNGRPYARHTAPLQESRGTT
jgi:hypothetical protein